MKVGKITKLYPLIKEGIIEILVFKISRDDYIISFYHMQLLLFNG